MNNKINIISGLDFNNLTKSLSLVKNSENTDYSKVSFTHGYGQLSKAGVTVQKGIRGSVDVSLKISTYSEDFYSAVTKDISTLVTKDVSSKLEENIKSKNSANWWFAIFAGGNNSNKDYQYYKDSKESSVQFGNSKIVDSLNTHSKDSMGEFEVKGHFEIIGTSNIPTTAYLFIETLTIKTTDGSTMTVVNSEPVAADKDGDKKGLETSGKLNIIPLG